MKKYLLLPLVALGLVAWVPNQAKAGVHVTFGLVFQPTTGRITTATIPVTNIITTRVGITSITTIITIVIGIVVHKATNQIIAASIGLPDSDVN